MCLELDDEFIALGPKYYDFLVPPDQTIRLPRDQTLPTATDLLRHHVLLLERINPQMLQPVNRVPHYFALLALGFHKVLGLLAASDPTQPTLNDPQVILIQTPMNFTTIYRKNR